MRNTYLNTLYNLAKNDKEIVSLVADNGLIVYDDFRKDFSDRYFNFGISEGHMIAAAAGMASCGKIPFVYTISAFLAYRGYEFLRDDVCFQNQNVKIVGIGSGLTYSTLGPSHHTTEDIGLLRSIPNLTVFSPSTRAEVKWVMEEAYRIKGSVYIRLSNNDKEYYNEERVFEIGVPAVVKNGSELTLITTGSIVNEVVKVSEMIKSDGISVEVVSVHSLKPINADAIASIASRTGNLVVIEEHNVIGGLYSAIAEALVERQVCVPCLKIGLQDTFAEGYGTIEEVRAENKLDSSNIYIQIRKFMNY